MDTRRLTVAYRDIISADALMKSGNAEMSGVAAYLVQHSITALVKQIVDATHAGGHRGMTTAKILREIWDNPAPLEKAFVEQLYQDTHSLDIWETNFRNEWVTLPDAKELTRLYDTANQLYKLALKVCDENAGNVGASGVKPMKLG